MSTEMRDERPVRTYRGRSLEELIPKIRQELGPDAIILREREGLTGGFNGFFQQRCVEVDAQAAPPPVDFYDDDEDALPGDAPHGPTRDSDDGRRRRRAGRVARPGRPQPAAGPTSTHRARDPRRPATGRARAPVPAEPSP